MAIANNACCRERRQRGFGRVGQVALAGLVLLLGSGLVAPWIAEVERWPQGSPVRGQIGQFGVGLDTFKLDVGRYPTTTEGLQALLVSPPGVTGWQGPYFKERSIPKDPWGNAYRYVSPGKHGPYDIVSWGADHREGGEGEDADIGSWN